VKLLESVMCVKVVTRQLMPLRRAQHVHQGITVVLVTTHAQSVLLARTHTPMVPQAATPAVLGSGVTKARLGATRVRWRA
jgi:hypothetical protein